MISLIIKATETYQELYRRYEILKQDKNVVVQRNRELLEELADPHARIKILEEQLKQKDAEISAKNVLIRQQTEADILWAARKIEQNEKQQTPAAIVDPRLQTYTHSGNSLSPSFEVPYNPLGMLRGRG